MQHRKAQKTGKSAFKKENLCSTFSVLLVSAIWLCLWVCGVLCYAEVLKWLFVHAINISERLSQLEAQVVRLTAKLVSVTLSKQHGLP